MKRVIAVALAAALLGAACGGNGDEEQEALNEEIEQAVEGAGIVAAQALLAATAFQCRHDQLDDDECRQELEKYSRGLLDSLEAADDAFQREQIDDALDTVKGLCDECEELLGEGRP